MFPRKSVRVAIQNSLQDKQGKLPELLVIPKKTAKKKTIPKIPNKKFNKNNKKAVMRSKKAEIQETLQVEEASKGVEDKTEVDPRRKIKLNPLLNFENGWKKEEITKTKNIKTLTDYDSIINFSTNDEIFKICSWSLDGLERFVEKGGLEFVRRDNAHIVCLQNLRTSDESIAKNKLAFDDEYKYKLFSLKCWMPGVAVYSKVKPLSIRKNTNYKKLNEIASVIISEFDDFVLVCVQAPSAGYGLRKLKQKLEWHEEFIELVEELRNDPKPLVVAGNFQTSLQEIDVANPQYSRYQAGFTKEETDMMSKVLELDLIDTFRKFHPKDRKGFTYFTNYGKQGHLMDQGSRIDYFFVSKVLQENVVNCVIRSDIVDFSHSPITLMINLSNLKVT